MGQVCKFGRLDHSWWNMAIAIGYKVNSRDDVLGTVVVIERTLRDRKAHAEHG